MKKDYYILILVFILIIVGIVAFQMYSERNILYDQNIGFRSNISKLNADISSLRAGLS